MRAFSQKNRFLEYATFGRIFSRRKCFNFFWSWQLNFFCYTNSKSMRLSWRETKDKMFLLNYEPYSSLQNFVHNHRSNVQKSSFLSNFILKINLHFFRKRSKLYVRSNVIFKAVFCIVLLVWELQQYREDHDSASSVSFKDVARPWESDFYNIN